MTGGTTPHRLDRTLRLTAGVLGVVVAIPSFLAFLFVVLFVWLGSEDTPIWLAVPLGLLAIVQLYLSITTLNARTATAVTVGLLGVLELAVGIVLLVATPTLLPATIAAIVVVFVAGAVALAAAIRIRRQPGSGGAAAPAVGGARTGPPGPAAPQPKRTGAPASKPGGASGAAQKSGGKKSGRKR